MLAEVPSARRTNRLPSIGLLFCLLCLPFKSVMAAGAPAGVDVINTVTVNFQVNHAPGTATASDTFRIDEVIDVVAVWQDGANVLSTSPANDRVLTFQVTNTGNGIESFSLRVDNAVPGDDFEPDTDRIFLDGNGNGLFDDETLDPLYLPGSNDLILNADGSIAVFVINNIPAGFINGQTGASRLIAEAVTASAPGSAPGTTLPGRGDNGSDAVVGNTNANAEATGRFEIQATASVTLNKSASVISDGKGCTSAPCNPVPGATIRYATQASVTGSGRVEGLLVSSPIPDNTTFVAGSITLNAVSLSDDTGDDAGIFSTNTVSVDLGDVSAAADYTITFDVTIN